MVRLPKGREQIAAPLFAGWDETMIWSCLQGRMGAIWCDNEEIPHSARLQIADFCFFAGAPMEDLLSGFPQELPPPLLLVPQNEGWNALIKHTYTSAECIHITRYATKKEPHVFDRKTLQAYVQALPPDYELRAIDGGLYRRALEQPWSKDLCTQFPDEAAYGRDGLGFAVLHKGALVCGASSYTVYDGGIEIEIDTKKPYRRQGLALACAARLILECLDRGLYPSWDAANPGSLQLAQKLGYTFSHTYDTYLLTPETGAKQ